jgi:hypothetical protein
MSHSSAAGESCVTISSENSQHLSLTELDDRGKVLALLLYTMVHFFGDIRRLFSCITDPRDPRKIVYPVGELAFAAILMFMCRLKSRRQIAFQLRGGLCADKCRDLFRVPDCPHGDTINDAFAAMDPTEFQNLLCGMVYCLIRKKVLYPFRLLDRYFVIAVDGTRTLTRNKRHCPRCLTQTQNGKTTYYHMVLEAKLVTTNGFAIPLFTEFVENTGTDSKQDCELKAFYRMADKIKAHFTRLPIMVTVDGLFACGPVFEVCKKHGWKVMAVLKDGSLPTVNQEFGSLLQLQPENRLTYRSLDGKIRVEQRFSWVNHISHTDTQNKEHSVDVIECIETREKVAGQLCAKKHRWVTNMSVSPRNVVPLANEGGRIRWKVENQGFNVQKNGGYGLTHMYSKNDNASKIFHLLMQIAHMLMQLLVKGGLKRWFPRGMGSVKNVGDRIKEAWRTAHLPEGILQRITQWRFQIRFCPDTS